MFALYRETGGHALQFYAAGRGSADQLREDVMAMLPTSLSCADDDVLCVVCFSQYIRRTKRIDKAR